MSLRDESPTTRGADERATIDARSSRRIRAALGGLVCLGVLGASVAHAAIAPRWLGFTFGADIPRGDLSKYVHTGTYLGGTGAYPLTPHMAVGIDIASHFWGDDKGTPLIPPPLSAVIIDSSIRMDEYSLAGLYLPLETNDRWIPYGRLAPGYYRLIGKVNTTSGDLKQAFDCFGLAVGAGVVYRLNGRFGVSADATYRHVWGREGLEFDPQDTTVGLGLLIGFAQ